MIVIVVSPGNDTRVRLGQLVSEQRKRHSLSVSAAARAAGIDRGTWTGLEKGIRDTEDYMHVRIERVLGWAPGSIDTILAGGQPAPAVTSGREPTETPPLPDDEAIIKVMQSDRIPEDQKRRIVAILIEDRERERQRRLALADDLIRTWSEAG